MPEHAHAPATHVCVELVVMAIMCLSLPCMKCSRVQLLLPCQYLDCLIACPCQLVSSSLSYWYRKLV
jgi:hypothetical protein